MNYFSITILLAKIIDIMINPAHAYIDQYKWTNKSVSINATDCHQNEPPIGIFCVSKFLLPGTSFALIVPDYASIIAIDLNPELGLFLAYNYTGPDWILQVGVRN